jgi:hypothetical protein
MKNAHLFYEISNLVDSLESNKLFVNLNDSSYVASKSDCLRITSQALTPGPLKNMLMKCMVDAESASAGGSFIMLKFLSLKDKSTFKNKSKNRRFSLLELEKSLINMSDQKSAKIAIESFSNLKTAPARLAMPDIPEPTSVALTRGFYIRAADIAERVMTMVGKDISVVRNELLEPQPHDVPGEWFKGPF